jgi:hypothetical protein
VNAYDKEIRLSGGLANMGKTVPSYRIALEYEIGRWKNFQNALPHEEDKLAFDALMDMCRDLASAGGCACNPIIFEPMAICILLAQQKKMQQLENELNDLLWQRSGEVNRHGFNNT